MDLRDGAVRAERPGGSDRIGRPGGSTGSAGRGGTDGGSAGRRRAAAARAAPAVASLSGRRRLPGIKCCGGFCVNAGNDILNCGTCGNTCSGTHPIARRNLPARRATLVGVGLQSRVDLLRREVLHGRHRTACTVTLGPTVTGATSRSTGRAPPAARAATAPRRRRRSRRPRRSADC